jgi:hypothetical protein
VAFRILYSLTRICRFGVNYFGTGSRQASGRNTPTGENAGDNANFIITIDINDSTKFLQQGKMPFKEDLISSFNIFDSQILSCQHKAMCSSSSHLPTSYFLARNLVENLSHHI